MAPFFLDPSRPMARKEDYEVGDCPYTEAAGLIKDLHYTGSAGNTAVAYHCLRRKLGGELVGAALWASTIKRPARLCATAVLDDPERWQEVLTLSRLVVRDEEPMNTAGLLLAASTRLVAQLREEPRLKRVEVAPGRWQQVLARGPRRYAAAITFADTSESHTGVLYRATGWTHAGMTEPIPKWEDAAGRTVAQKATVNRTVAQMKALGYEMVGRFRKHRFYRAL